MSGDLQSLLGEAGLRIVDSNAGGTILALGFDGSALSANSEPEVAARSRRRGTAATAREQRRAAGRTDSCLHAGLALRTVMSPQRPTFGPASSPGGACGADVFLLRAGCDGNRGGAPPHDDGALDRRIVVAIAEKPDPMMASGSSPRGYAGLPAYSGSERTRATSTRLARDHDLTEISAWTIEPLNVRCMLYEIPASADRASVLAELRKDRRVHLAQPLQEFTTLTTAPAESSRAAIGSQTPDFNDPYVGLQTGFSSIGAGQAQRWASGENVSVALIDTGVDASHPDLAGRIGEQRDFVGGDRGRSDSRAARYRSRRHHRRGRQQRPRHRRHRTGRRTCFPIAHAGRSATACSQRTLQQLHAGAGARLRRSARRRA